MSDKSPAFQFYPGDFLSDKNTLLMSADEIGAYTILMCVCWKEGSLPDDVEDMALLSRMDTEQFKSSWEKRVSRCFVKNDHGEWVHPRLEKERQKQEEYKEKKSKAGRKGAESRWKNTDNDSEKENNGTAMEKNGSAKEMPMANDGPSSSTSSSTSDNKPYTDDFEDFWETYDVKKGKKKAWLEWKKLTGPEKEKIMENVPIFLTHFSSDQYTPRPRKYLYNRYWEDEGYQEPNKQTNGQETENRAERFFRIGEEIINEN